jgi:transcription factor STE12
MAPPQKPETFMLSTEAQQSLPHDAQVALQQVDNRMSFILLGGSPASKQCIDLSQ